MTQYVTKENDRAMRLILFVINTFVKSIQDKPLLLKKVAAGQRITTTDLDGIGQNKQVEKELDQLTRD